MDEGRRAIRSRCSSLDQKQNVGRHPRTSDHRQPTAIIRANVIRTEETAITTNNSNAMTNENENWTPTLADRERAFIKNALEKFDSKIPPRYLATNTAHRDFNRALWERIRHWQPSADAPWLGLIGPSGGCKTRCGVLCLRNQIEAKAKDCFEWKSQPPSTLVITAYDLATAIRSQFSTREAGQRPGVCGGSFTEGDIAKKLLEEIRAAHLLMIDDLGKARATPAAVAGLFELIDHRHAHNLPLIWTSNLPVEGIVAGMPPDIAEPLGGRLIECSTIINA